MQKASRPRRIAFRDKYLAAFGVVALMLCSLFGRAQVFQNPPGTFGLGNHRTYHDSVLYFPTGCGVPSGIASLRSFGFGNGEKKRMAAIIADTCGGHVYWFNWTDTTWRQLDGGAGGTGSADSLKHLFVDTGSIAHQNYVLGFDSVNRKWVLLAQSGGTPFDSTTSQGGGFHTQTYFDSRYLRRADSATSYVTPKRLADSIAAVRAALSGTDTTIFRATGVTGQVPFYLSVVGGINTLSFPKFRDTSSAGIALAPDSAITIPTHDSTSANAMQTQYRADTARLNRIASLLLKVNISDSAGPGYATFLRLKKVADSLALLINKKVNISDSAGAGYATFNRLRKVADSLGALITGGGSTDSSLFVTSTRLNKNAAGGDTAWHVIYGIPQPSGTGVNGTPITWAWLITGGSHAFSPDLDSCLFVASSGHLQVGFATPADVAVGGLFGDEQTYPLTWQVIGNNDNYDFGAWVKQSGIGVNLVGSGAGGVWSTQGASTMGPYTFTIDTSTQGIISFDLIDGNTQYLGATTNGVTVVYNGQNGYSLKRLFAGLTRNYKYQILDAAGNPVIGQPAATDRIGIVLPISYHTFVDMRQFTSANQFYFGSGLPNLWFIGMIKLHPDSLKIIRPVTFTATALTATTASITWSAVSNAAAGYQLDRSTNPNFSASVTNLLTGAGTSFSDSGLTTGTTYYYRIRAIRVSGQYSGWKLRQITTP